MPNRVGQQFGNYRLKRLIGRGGYAEVYLAEHIQLSNLQHAIKILTGSSLEEYQREEFLAEARTIASLQGLSQHIVQIRDFGIQRSDNGLGNGIPYFVMEYAAAGTLRDLYPQGTVMSLERIIFYVNQIAEALQCAHDQDPPVMHRDIKPGNMLLRTRDHVLLSDFGIAIASNTSTLTPVFSDPNVVGTAAYIAPERLKGRVKRASDQYSLGVVVYEWLCGSRPFEGTAKEICYLHLTAPPPPLHEDYPHIKPEVEAVVMRALAKKPEERYPSIRAFAQALTEAAQQVEVPAFFSIAIPSEEKAQLKESQLVGHQMIPMATPIAHRFVDVTEMDTKHLQRANRSRKPAKQQKVTEQPPILLPLQPVLEPISTYDRLGPSSNPWPTPIPKSTSSTTSRSSIRRMRDFFDFSPQFAHDPRYSSFRILGTFLNILAPFAVTFLIPNIWILPTGLLYTLLLFALCIRAVEEVLAAFFGILVAVYWGWLGWLLGEKLAEYGYIDNLFFAGVGGGTLFFLVSLILHTRYVSRKNA